MPDTCVAWFNASLLKSSWLNLADLPHGIEQLPNVVLLIAKSHPLSVLGLLALRVLVRLILKKSRAPSTP